MLQLLLNASVLVQLRATNQTHGLPHSKRAGIPWRAQCRVHSDAVSCESAPECVRKQTDQGAWAGKGHPKCNAVQQDTVHTMPFLRP